MSDSRFSPFETMLAAKRTRDHVRSDLVRALRQVDGLPAEIVALLRADERATELMREAVQEEAAHNG
jgi:hypothetical protein